MQANEWLRDCEKHHLRYRCSLPDQKPFEVTLVDCITRELQVHQGSETYAALSYVWGGISQPPSQDGEVSRNASVVIIDAMDVTQQLGFQYLWVDQYCIDQTDQSVKQLQLSNMDLIYSHAEVTIVAACGTDAKYGLPVVNELRKVSALPYPRIEDASYLLGTAVKTIVASQWSSRR